MFTVRITPYRPGLATIMHRQTPGHQLVSRDGRYKFLMGGDEIEEADFWVVQGKGTHTDQTCRVAPQNTLLLTTEPKTILVYPQAYLDQFGLVCSCQEETRHRNLHLGPAILPWFVGYKDMPDGTIQAWLDYDVANRQPMPPEPKTKLLSVITSDKAMTQGHIDRIRLVKRLKQHYGDQLDVFGRGIHDFNDKWETLAPYKYHLVIENGQHSYYWTEKLSDCYLTGTFPFYMGCTNIDQFFAKEAYIPLSMEMPVEQIIATIDRAIREDTYEKALPALADARRLVLDKYNMFDYIAALCDTLDPNAPKEQVTLKACHSASDWHNLWQYTFGRTYYKMKFKALETLSPIRVTL